MGLSYKYYNGERECPYSDDGRHFFWLYEKWWHDSEQSREHSDDVISTLVANYKEAGLANFEASDGVPIELKSIFYDRYMYHFDYKGKEQFMNLYKTYYGHGTDRDLAEIQSD